jgi:hypothetical protein
MHGAELHDVHGADAGTAAPGGFAAGGAGPSSGATGRPKRAAAQKVLTRCCACCACGTACSMWLSASVSIAQFTPALALLARHAERHVPASPIWCRVSSGQGSAAHTLQGGVRSLGDLQDEDGNSDSSGDQGNELFTGGAKRCSL